MHIPRAMTVFSWALLGVFSASMAKFVSLMDVNNFVWALICVLLTGIRLTYLKEFECDMPPSKVYWLLSLLSQ